MSTPESAPPAPVKLELVRALDGAWTTVPAVPVGLVPAGGGAPEMHLLIEQTTGGRLRADLYTDRTAELYVAEEAVFWAGWVVIGLGHAVYLLDVHTAIVRTVRLPLYFQRFVESDEWLLAVSGAGITRFNTRGEVDWENDSVAVDGVTIEDVRDGVITGDAEWDPPGGWRPFRVDLATGEALPGATA